MRSDGHGHRHRGPTRSSCSPASGHDDRPPPRRTQAECAFRSIVHGRPPPGAHTSTGDRYGNHSTILTSQLPSESWHDHVGEPTIADAISDRLLYNAHKINLKGDSRRKDEKARSQWLTRVAPLRS
ncbi:MAG: ATP-binding protein, partial [Deltaproteobacteria bacterium]|nr:ATP-binding protein [Deltaproteobacteria bacterium]